MTYIFRSLTLVAMIGYLALPFALAKKQKPVEDPKCPQPDNVNVTVFRDVYPGALDNVCFNSFSSSWYWLQWSAWNDTILTSREAFKEIDGCMTIYTFDNPKQRALDGAIANWDTRTEDNWWQNNARSPYCADISQAQEPPFKRGGCTIEEGKYWWQNKTEDFADRTHFGRLHPDDTSEVLWVIYPWSEPVPTMLDDAGKGLVKVGDVKLVWSSDVLKEEMERDYSSFVSNLLDLKQHYVFDPVERPSGDSAWDLRIEQAYYTPQGANFDRKGSCAQPAPNPFTGSSYGSSL